jgi:hypothetical protein
MTDGMSQASSMVAARSPTKLEIRTDVFPNGDEYHGEHITVEDIDPADKKKPAVLRKRKKKALKHGWGTYKYSCGSRFEGYYFEDNMLEGQFYHAATRTIYHGRFHESHYHGQGRIVYPTKPRTDSDPATTGEHGNDSSSSSSSSRDQSATGTGTGTGEQHQHNMVRVWEVEYEGGFDRGHRGGYGKVKLSDGRWIEGMFRGDKLLATLEEERDNAGHHYTVTSHSADGSRYTGSLNKLYQYHTHHLYENNNNHNDSISSNSDGHNIRLPASGHGSNSEASLQLPSGDVLSCHFEDGVLIEPAKITLANGDTWFGHIDHDTYKMCGEGKLSYHNGNVYIGTVRSGGIKHGEGTQIAVNGGTYKGQYEYDEFHGHGIMKFVDGSTYEGEWKHGLRDGTGTMTFNTGNVYEGQWKADKKHGVGEASFKNGDVFMGTYQNDRRHGPGTMRFADRTRKPEKAQYENGTKVSVDKGSSGKKPVTNSIKFIGRIAGLRQHGDPLGKGNAYVDVAGNTLYTGM